MFVILSLCLKLKKRKSLIITVTNEPHYKRKRLMLRISLYLVYTSNMNEILIASYKLKCKKQVIISQV